jgi:hypothetical protein
MRKIQISIFSFLLISTLSCTKDKSDSLRIQIINSSNSTLDLVYVSTVYNDSKTIDYKIDSQNEINIDYTLNANGDGAYRVFYKFLNTKDTLRKDFGYYSNGAILDKGFVIKIYNDSIRIDTKK